MQEYRFLFHSQGGSDIHQCDSAVPIFRYSQRLFPPTSAYLNFLTIASGKDFLLFGHCRYDQHFDVKLPTTHQHLLSCPCRWQFKASIPDNSIPLRLALSAFMLVGRPSEAIFSQARHKIDSETCSVTVDITCLS